MIFKSWVVFLAFLLTVIPLALAFQGNTKRFYELSPSKELSRPQPKDYQSWRQVGSSVIPDDRNNNKALFPGIHQVFIDPVAWQYRQEKGVFPDGTIIVMDIQHIGFKESEGGYGYFTTGGQDLLVQVKDRRVFPGSGWGYYAFYDKEIKAGKAVAAPQDNRCGSCHQAGAGDDEVFTQYYPDLKAP